MTNANKTIGAGIGALLSTTSGSREPKPGVGSVVVPPALLRIAAELVDTPTGVVPALRAAVAAELRAAAG